MGKIFHISIDIKGLLNHKDLSGLLEDKGMYVSDKEARAYLNEKIALGWKVIPSSDECDNFDHLKGCGGHNEPNFSLPKPANNNETPKQIT